MPNWDWAAIGGGAAAAAAIIAIVALVVTAIQARFLGQQVQEARRQLELTREQAEQARHIALGDFVLRLDQVFHGYPPFDRVHRDLRGKTGKWSQPGSGPKSEEEWADVEAYMGLFERINILIKQGLVPLDPIIMSYKYRMENLVANDRIYQEKLRLRRQGWMNFVELAHAMDVRRPDGSEV